MKSHKYEDGNVFEYVIIEDDGDEIVSTIVQQTIVSTGRWSGGKDKPDGILCYTLEDDRGNHEDIEEDDLISFVESGRWKLIR